MFRVIPRMESAYAAILFLPDIEANPGMIACYAYLGQHGEASLDYYRKNTRKPRRGEADELVREYRALAGEYCTLRQRLRRTDA